MTETFDADWLRMREPVDHAARSSELEAALMLALTAPHQEDSDLNAGGFGCDDAPHASRFTRERPLRVLDLGSGRGSNLRHLAPRLRGMAPHQAWTLVDHDSELLAETAAKPAVFTVRPEAAGAAPELSIATRVADFASGAAALIDTLQPQLVTAAALIDLVSAAWLEDLVEACRRNDAAVLITLTYAGRFEFEATRRAASRIATGDVAGDEDAEIDRLVLGAINAHQRTDKGFGAALGPDAGATLQRRLAAHGYRSLRRESSWRLGAADTDLATALIDGWIAVTRAQTPDAAAALERWRACRLEALASGALRLRVQHDDVLGVFDR